MPTIETQDSARTEQGDTKMPFTVALEKDYHNEATGDLITVEGTMTVKANSQEEAESIVLKEIKDRKLGTIDPRITWEEDCVDLDEQGYTYVDFSFGLADPLY